MKDKFICITLIITILFTVCATTVQGKTQIGNSSMFIVLESRYDYRIVYNKNTKVMYAISDGSYNKGTFTLLVNADGTPMIYE